LRSTVVDVDLDAIAANAASIARVSGAAIIAVVKADAYGHGVEPVARALLDAGAAMLAVFTVEEGMALRRAIGPEADILVLVGASGPDEIDAAVAERLTLVVWDEDRARAIAASARARRTLARVHFKVDTGLTRLGAPLADAVRRYRAVGALDGLEVDGIFSHLANADEPDDTFSPVQVDRFREIVTEIGVPPRWVHLVASAGVASIGRLPFCNAVRPGLALYGLHAAPHLADAITLRPALAWRSAVARVARAPAGTGVSYGHLFTAARDTCIATVPVGYGDGLPRAATGRLSLLVGGEAAPIAGRVCMDLVMLDLGDGEARVGDEVVVIGAQGKARQTADDVAAACGTISYEIVTGVRPRVPRRYLRGGRIVATKTLYAGVEWT